MAIASFSNLYGVLPNLRLRLFVTAPLVPENGERHDPVQSSPGRGSNYRIDDRARTLLETAAHHCGRLEERRTDARSASPRLRSRGGDGKLRPSGRTIRCRPG